MSTLKEISELIRNNDSEIIDNQEVQSESLRSIDVGIQKFLANQEKSRLDNLEDRREARRAGSRLPGGIGGAAAAAGGLGLASTSREGGGVGSNALSNASYTATGIIGGLLLRPIARMVAGLLPGSTGENIRLNRSLDSTGAEVNRINEAERKRLNQTIRETNAEINRLKKEQLDLRNSLRDADSTRIKDLETLRSQNSASLKSLQDQRRLQDIKMAELQKELNDIRNARSAVKTDSKNLKIADQTLTAKELERIQSSQNARNFTNNIVPGDTFEYKTQAGKTIPVKAVSASADNVVLESGGKQFAVNAENLQQRINFDRGSKFSPFSTNNFLRAATITDPFSAAETAAAGASKITSGTVSKGLGRVSRILGSGAAFGILTAFDPKKMGDGTLSAELAGYISRLFNAIHQNKSVDEIMIARGELRKYLSQLAPPGSAERDMFIQEALTMLGLDRSSYENLMFMISSPDPEFATMLKKFYIERGQTYNKAKMQALNKMQGISDELGLNSEMRSAYISKNLTSGLNFTKSISGLSQSQVASQAKLDRLEKISSAGTVGPRMSNANPNALMGNDFSTNDQSVNTTNAFISDAVVDPVDRNDILLGPTIAAAAALGP